MIIGLFILRHFKVFEKKIKCLFQTNVPTVVVNEAYEDKLEEKEQSSLVTVDIRGIFITINFFNF